MYMLTVAWRDPCVRWWSSRAETLLCNRPAAAALTSTSTDNEKLVETMPPWGARAECDSLKLHPTIHSAYDFLKHIIC